MIACAYTRVSTAEQSEGHSIGAQIHEIKKYCEKNNIELINIYTDDGISGQKEDRPEFQKMLKDAEKGLFTVILVHKFDRFARKIELSHKIKSQLKKHSVNVISITEPIEDSPIGFFQEGLLELLAEYYIKNLSKEVKKGMIQRARKGLPLGIMPFGYDVKDDTITINEQEAEVVRKIFDLYVNEGMGYIAIATYLNENGYIKKPRSSFWRESAVRETLEQPKYAGIFLYDGEEHPCTWEPIISRELWNKYEDVRGVKGKRFNYRGNNFSKFALLGLMKCGKCGGTITLQINGTGKRTSSRHTFMCNLAKRQLKLCNENKQHHADKLEASILETIELVACGSITDFEVEEIKTSALSISKRRFNICNELERAKQAYMVGVFSLNEYGTIKKRLESELAQLNEEPQQDKRTEIANKARNIVDKLKEAVTANDKRILLSEIIHCIYLSREKIRIVFKG